MSQSKRQVGKRLKENQKAVSTLDKGKSALAEHVCYTKHEIAWENSKVITMHKQSLYSKTLPRSVAYKYE
jgi:hypothetical protein